MEILTDIALRAHWFRSHEKAYHVSKDTMLTPAARDFIREHGITLIYEDSALEGQPEVEVSSVPESVKTVNQLPDEAMPMAAVPQGADHKPQYVNGETGEVLSVKPENMTHLHGNVLVPKTHPQIAFRGMLDSLEAKIMSLQVVASENGLHRLTDALDEVLAYVRQILSAEVLDKELGEIHLLCLDSAGLRYESHHIKEIYGIPHPMPEYRMGRICIGLNDRIGGGQSFPVRGYMYTAGYCGSHESAQQCHLYSVLQAADGQVARSAGAVRDERSSGISCGSIRASCASDAAGD